MAQSKLSDLNAVKAPLRPQPRFSMGRVILALILREMSATYGRNPGGYIWAILQPVATIVILVLAFSFVLRSPSLGTSFPLFYATAVLPIRLFQELSQVTGFSMIFNFPLMGYPRVTYVESFLSRAILCILTQIMVSVIILFGISIIYGERITIDFRPVLIAYGTTIFLALGFGLFNCYAIIAFPVWKTIWNILTRPLMLISGLFYVYEDLPRIAQEILWYNPLVHITGLNRTGFYSTYSPEYITLSYVYILSIILMFFGALLLYRYSKHILSK
jgi:capsular polysaccharide transport system permease protein